MLSRKLKHPSKEGVAEFSSYLNRVVREGFTKKEIFEKRSEEDKEVSGYF